MSEPRVHCANGVWPLLEPGSASCVPPRTSPGFTPKSTASTAISRPAPPPIAILPRLPPPPPICDGSRSACSLYFTLPRISHCLQDSRDPRPPPRSILIARSRSGPLHPPPTWWRQHHAGRPVGGGRPTYSASGPRRLGTDPQPSDDLLGLLVWRLAVQLDHDAIFIRFEWLQCLELGVEQRARHVMVTPRGETGGEQFPSSV